MKLGTALWLQDKSFSTNSDRAFEAAWVLDLTNKQITLKIIFLVKILWNWVLFCGSKVKNQLQPTSTGPLKPFFAYFWRTSKAFSWRFMSRKLSFLTQLHSANTIHSCQKRAWKGDNSLNLSSKKIEKHQVWSNFQCKNRFIQEISCFL